ncbi:hypothetical protein [Mesorhizobium sp. L-8-3]|uniref:hypothetical protein n=1 Tax=Mesorhizobium sp. L-8-3 TaxID=2744522 RepID=UPI001927CF09|nr:hypothetical protein [Mesorhizobium sp. L-8-3]BCH27961.1 hypothetical protein MesoLjLb_77460 [Mesorhizobium sp. L-8-3]
MLTERERTKLLGIWGEHKALALLARAGFSTVRDVNAETFNHPFGDIYAERAGERYLIGVKTRNKYQVNGSLNPTYNVRKKGADVLAIARPYKAQLAWVTVQVIPERQVFWSYFGTIALIEDRGERFSIPMQVSAIRRYECLAYEETDTTLRLEFSNGGYAGQCD